MSPLASPSIIPRLLSPGTQAACDRRPVGCSPPLPALPSTQERQGHPSQGDRMGLKGPRPERASGTGGPPQVGEARWLVGQHPTLSCRLGRSRRVLQVLLACAPPQGRSQPQAPRASAAPYPLPQPHSQLGWHPPRSHPSPLAACPGLELF